MKVSITFKTPDAVEWAVADKENEDEIREKLKKWIRYGEQIIVEFDLEKMTATVKEIR